MFRKWSIVRSIFIGAGCTSKRARRRSGFVSPVKNAPLTTEGWAAERGVWVSRVRKTRVGVQLRTQGEVFIYQTLKVVHVTRKCNISSFFIRISQENVTSFFPFFEGISQENVTHLLHIFHQLFTSKCNRVSSFFNTSNMATKHLI